MAVAWEDFGTYSTDIFTKESVRIIRNHGENFNTSKPLFLYLAYQVVIFKIWNWQKIVILKLNIIFKQAVHSANSYSPLQAPQEVVDKFSYIEVRILVHFLGFYDILKPDFITFSFFYILINQKNSTNESILQSKYPWK